MTVIWHDKDKKHVLFSQCPEACALRCKYEDQFANLQQHIIPAHGQGHHSGFVLVISVLRKSISPFRTNKQIYSHYFGYHVLFQAGNAQQAQQSTHLADGLTLMQP